MRARTHARAQTRTRMHARVRARTRALAGQRAVRAAPARGRAPPREPRTLPPPQRRHGPPPPPAPAPRRPPLPACAARAQDAEQEGRGGDAQGALQGAHSFSGGRGRPSSEVAASAPVRRTRAQPSQVPPQRARPSVHGPRSAAPPASSPVVPPLCAPAARPGPRQAHASTDSHIDTFAGPGRGRAAGPFGLPPGRRTPSRRCEPAPRAPAAIGRAALARPGGGLT